MQRTELEKACLRKVKKRIENEEIKTMTDLMSEIMLNFDPKLGYGTELIKPTKLLIYYPDLAELLLSKWKTRTDPLSRFIASFNLDESIRQLKEIIQMDKQVKLPDSFITFDQWEHEKPPVDLALYKDYPKILEYPSLTPYRNFLLERYVRKGTAVVYCLPNEFSDWTMAYVQEKSLNPSESLKEQYRLERRINKIEDFQERTERNRFSMKLVGKQVPIWKLLLYSKELRKKATITNVGLENFRMIKYFGRPTEKVERERELIVRLALQMVEGISYRKVNREYIREITKIYPWESRVWLPHMGLAKWRMMLFSPLLVRKKLLERRLLGRVSIRKYLSRKNVFYVKYPHLVAI